MYSFTNIFQGTGYNKIISTFSVHANFSAYNHNTLQFINQQTTMTLFLKSVFSSIRFCFLNNAYFSQQTLLSYEVKRDKTFGLLVYNNLFIYTLCEKIN